MKLESIVKGKHTKSDLPSVAEGTAGTEAEMTGLLTGTALVAGGACGLVSDAVQLDSNE